MKGSSKPARNGLKKLSAFNQNALVFFGGVDRKARAFWSKRRQGFQPISSYYRRTFTVNSIMMETKGIDGAATRICTTLIAKVGVGSSMCSVVLSNRRQCRGAFSSMLGVLRQVSLCVLHNALRQACIWRE